MNYIMYVGLLAGLLTTFGAFPQVLKSMRTKKTQDLSLMMIVVIFFGLALWLAYGVLLSDLPLIMWNIIACIFYLILLVLKLKYK